MVGRASLFWHGLIFSDGLILCSAAASIIQALFRWYSTYHAHANSSTGLIALSRAFCPSIRFSATSSGLSIAAQLLHRPPIECWGVALSMLVADGLSCGATLAESETAHLLSNKSVPHLRATQQGQHQNRL